jgi:hypothetical protein
MSDEIFDPEFSPNPGEENRHERHTTQRRADHRDPEAR